MTTWFTADLHLGHRNIMAYCNRPFNEVETMNRALIDGWNEVVTDDDEVWVLGDFALGKLADTLPLAGELRGRKFLLAGNHDRCWHGHSRRAEGWTQRYLDAGFCSRTASPVFAGWSLTDGPWTSDFAAAMAGPSRSRQRAMTATSSSWPARR